MLSSGHTRSANARTFSGLDLGTAVNDGEAFGGYAARGPADVTVVGLIVAVVVAAFGVDREREERLHGAVEEGCPQLRGQGRVVHDEAARAGERVHHLGAHGCP